MHTDGTERIGQRPSRGREARSALEDRLATGARSGRELEALVGDRTVSVRDGVDEAAFFSRDDGTPTVASRYDLERAVPDGEKPHLRELERYWVNEPFAFVVVFRSERENERKYYLIEPSLTAIERELRTFLAERLRTSIAYADGESPEGDDGGRRSVVESELRQLLERYGLVRESADGGGLLGRVASALGAGGRDGDAGLEGAEVRPERAILEADPETLSEYQIEKLRYI